MHVQEEISDIDIKRMVGDVHLEGDRRYKMVGKDQSVKDLRLACIGPYIDPVIEGSLTKFSAAKSYLYRVEFKKFKFSGCTFSHSFLDGAKFVGAIFINCHFICDFVRWCRFENCSFKNCIFDIKYIRSSTFDSKCSAKNLKINICEVDEYLYLAGKRYSTGYYDIDIVEHMSQGKVFLPIK
jgi:hypothetical protein